ncbi:MAG: peptidoglycan-binding protein [Leptolyngbyaceae cyanobacterium SL_1_1]|nr:peptidoglycan-binding protein [Leptolyngbyaceae cyanobacterium SL_1_1]
MLDPASLLLSCTSCIQPTPGNDAAPVQPACLADQEIANLAQPTASCLPPEAALSPDWSSTWVIPSAVQLLASAPTLKFSEQVALSSSVAEPAFSEASNAPATAAAAAAPVLAKPRPRLQLGSEGADVRRLQTVLRQLGYRPGLVDGRYEQLTRTAVLAFQQAQSLKQDGIVGPKTWVALERQLQNASSSQALSAPAPQPLENTPENSPDAIANPLLLENLPNLPENAPTAAGAEATGDPSRDLISAASPKEESSLSATVLTEKFVEDTATERWILIWGMVHVGGWLLIAQQTSDSMVHLSHLSKKFGKLRPVKLGQVNILPKLSRPQKPQPRPQRSGTKRALSAHLPAEEFLADLKSETQIVTLLTSDLYTGATYRYSLVDDAEGYFILRENELCLINHKCKQSDLDAHKEVVVRRIDSAGALSTSALKFISSDRSL